MTTKKIYKSSDLDEDRVRQDVVGFSASPLFSSVLRDYTSALVGFRQDPLVVNKLISHETRFRVINHLLYVHADKVLAGGAGGATYGEMLDLCVQFPDIGLRVVKSMLPMLVLGGFAHVARDPLDRRVKIYTPSEKLVATVHARLAPIVAALQVLEPDIPRAELLRDDPMFFWRVICRNGRAQLDGGPLVTWMSTFNRFTGSREGAGQVIYAVMLADMDGVSLLSRSALAKQFGLSKTQVWSVFAEGQRIGYFSDEGGVPVATTKLRDEYREWTAVELAFSAGVLRPLD
jgi:hypothetical protein